MAFTQQPDLVATSIGQITHILADKPGNQSLRFVLIILDQFGLPMKVFRGDESPHLTVGQINQLQEFMIAQRAKFLAIEPTVGDIYHVFNDGDGSPGSRGLRHVARVPTGPDLRGDEVPHMTPGQITAATTFLDAQRAKAIAEIL